MTLHRHLAFLAAVIFGAIASASGQSTPLTRELQRDAGTAYAQDVLDQANARAALEDAQKREDDNALFELFSKEPANGFERYAQSQHGLWSKAVHQATGVHGYSSNPYQHKTAREVIAIMRASYSQLPPDERARFDGAMSQRTLSSGGTGLSTGGLETGGLSAPMPSRTRPRSAPPASAPTSGGWFTDQINAGGAIPTATNPQQSQASAVQKYPALARAGSPLNKEFVARARKYRVTTPNYFDDPGWPGKLAEESVTALANGTAIAP